MRIKRVIVGNYKNLAETAIDLCQVVALVSTNNYGKTNLLEALKFGFEYISSSPKSRLSMMNWVRGIPLAPEIAGKEFYFCIEFDDPSLGEYRFVRYSFSFAWHNDQGTGSKITDETLEMRSNESTRYKGYLKRDKGYFRASKDKTGFRKLLLASNTLAIDAISAIKNVEIVNVVGRIKEISYKMCDTLELDRNFLPIPIEIDYGSDSSFPFDDDDIPRALSVLKKEKPEKYELFIETIYDLFPEFNNVELKTYTLKPDQQAQIKAIVVSDDKQEEIPYRIRDELHRIIIESSYLNQPLSLEYMSAGTKRIFWLIANAVFSGCYGTNVLSIDEIETSIHPRMIKNLLTALVDILGDTSLLVTSHSPYLIQYLKPESIYVGVPNSKGIAIFKRVQAGKVKTLLNASRDQDLSVGEYIFELMSGDDDAAAVLSAYLEEN